MAFYERSTLIECSQEDLYAFHLDVGNLVKITPKGMSVKLLNEDFVPREGAVLRLKSVKNFIPMNWEVKIETMDEPRLLIDIATRSPFAFWKHSHIFTQVSQTQCELKDIVEFVLPFGAFGRLFEGFVKREFDAMFAFRHRVTKEMLEESIDSSLAQRAKL